MKAPNIEELIARNDVQRRNANAKPNVFLAADNIAALQSQAEHIKALERESETYAKAYGLAIVERDNLRAELAELVEALEYHIEQTRPIERSTIALSKYKGAK